MRFNFRGLMAPVFTPFKDTAQYELDLNGLSDYYYHLNNNKIHGILVNGTTGEGMSMTVEERKTVLEAWMKVNNSEGSLLTVMAQVGGAPMTSIKDLCKHAQSVGVNAILCLPDLYFKPKNEDELTDYLMEIGKAAPSVPLLYYHIPAFTQVNLDMELVMSKCADRVPSFAGIKFTHYDLDEGSRCVHHNDRNFSVFLGADQVTAGAWQLGFDSAISTTLNMYPQFSNTIISSFADHNHEFALEKQLQLNRRIKKITSLGTWVGSMKAAMQVITGLNMGPPRPPLARVSEHEMQLKLKCVD